MSAFIEALRSAATDSEAMKAISEAVKAGSEPPTPEALAEWWASAPGAAISEAVGLLRNLASFKAAHAMDGDKPDAFRDPLAKWPRFEVEGGPLQASPETRADDADPLRLPRALVAIFPRVFRPEEYPDGVISPIPVGPAVLSRFWVEARGEGFEGRHPLGPIVRAWIERPANVTPWPGMRRVSLPDLGNPSEDVSLPDLGNQPEAPEQLALDLPGLDAAGEALPHWVLRLFEYSGGPISEGRRLPMSLTLAVGALCRLPVERRTGAWHTLRFPHRIEHEDPEIFPGDPGESLPAVERWTAPDGWGNRYRDWARIPRGLADARRKLAYLPVPGLGLVALIFPSVIPKRRSDPLVEFTIRIPASGARGARMDWPRFARYAVESAALARAYLSASAHMGRAAHEGHPITRMIPAPILGTDGNPIRRGGRILRSKTEIVRNPHARYVKALTDTQLARMIGYPESKARERRKRHRAREAFERLAADGVIELEADSQRFRIFGPSRSPAK